MAGKDKKFKTPVWLQWLMLGFIAFVILNQLIAGQGDPTKLLETTPEALLSPKRNTKDPVHQDPQSDVAVSYADMLFPAVPSRVEVIEKKLGEGARAVCGSTVSVRYDAKFQDGSIAESNRKDKAPLTFVVGEKKALPALEQAVETMRVGGVREVASLPGLAYGHPDHKKESIPELAHIFFDVELVEVRNPEPTVPDNMLGFRSFNDKFQTGWFANCGDTLPVHLRVFDKNGQKRFDNRENGDKKPLNITVGASQVPYGIEQGLLGIRKDVARTVFVPVEYARPLDPTKPSELHTQLSLPENEPFIVELELAR